MMRAFLAKRNFACKKEKVRQDSIKEGRLSKESSLSKEASVSRQDSEQNAGNDEILDEEWNCNNVDQNNL